MSRNPDGRDVIIVTTEMAGEDVVRRLIKAGVLQTRQTERGAKPGSVPIGKSKHQLENEERLRRQAEDRGLECQWIGERLTADIAALGGGPVLHKVEAKYENFIVTMLQWQSNGIAVEVQHEFKPQRKDYWAIMERPKLEKAVSGRFSQLLRRQAEHVATRGTPRRIEPADIDLSNFRIEKPLARMMERAFADEAAALMRSAMADNRTTLVEDHNWRRDKRLENARIQEHELLWGKGVVRGAFSTSDGDVSMAWSKGSFALFGLELPEVVWTGCVGRRLGDLIDHPLFDGDMVITAAHPTRAKGGGGEQGWTLMLKDTTEPVSAEW